MGAAMDLEHVALTDQQRTYVKEKALPLLVDMVQQCLQEKPEDPKAWMKNWLSDSSNGPAPAPVKGAGKGAGKKGAPPPPGGHPKASHAVGFKKPLSEEERAKKEKLDEEKIQNNYDAALEVEIED